MKGRLDVDAEEFRRLALRAVDLVTGHLAGIRERDVYRPMTPAARQHLLTDTLPEDGASPEAILERVPASVLSHPMGNGHPRFFGWVNSPPAPLGVLADFLAAALNPSCAGGDHAAIYVERCAVRWLMELVGFPTAGSMGLLVSGSSAATLVALAAARQRAVARYGGDVRQDGLQTDGKAFVTGTVVRGRFALRACVLHFQTSEEDIDALIRTVRDAGAACAG